MPACWLNPIHFGRHGRRRFRASRHCQPPIDMQDSMSPAMTAICGIPSVQGTNREGQLRVDMTRPVSRRRRTGTCAFRPKTGIGERRPRQIVRHQQTWRPLSAQLADPRRSLCAWARSRQAGSKKPVAWENAAAAKPQYCHCRARQQGCADRLELAYQRLRNKSAGAITTCPFSAHASPSTTRPLGPIARPVWPSRS